MNADPTAYSPQQEDALREVANIAMGQAASSLARLLDSYVTLSVPRSRIVKAAEVCPRLVEMAGRAEGVIAVRQAFYGPMAGEAVLMFGPNGCDALADALGYPVDDAAASDELLLDVSNILVGAVLNGIGGQIEADFGFNPPQLMGRRVALDSVLGAEALTWSHALLIEVNFAMAERDFTGHLVLLMPAGAIDTMRGVIDAMLAEL